jgi:cysteine-rich repeat protein
MKRDVLRCLFSAALVAAACAKGSAADGDRLCVPDAFVFCRCGNGSEGSKKCNAEGDGFGECQQCQQSVQVCTPGQTQLCTCDDGVSQGTQVCYADGTGFDTTCGGCPFPTAGTGGRGGTAGDGGFSGGPGGESGRGGEGGRGGDAGAAGSSGEAGSSTGGSAGTSGSSGTGGSSSGGCGNNVVTEDEQCDDGNKNNGDFCSAQCSVTVPTVGGGKAGCSNGVPLGGVPVHVFDTEVILSGNTTNTGSNATGTTTLCDNGPGGASPDVIFAVTAHRSGNLRAFVNADFDSMLYARSGECDGGTQRDCEDFGGSGETIFVPMTTGQTVWVVVDGFKDTAAGSPPDRGPFQLSLSIVD